MALLYRHWSSKKALYLEVLRSVWTQWGEAISAHFEKEQGAAGVVGAYLDVLLADTEGSQILVREYLDGGPFLSQLVASDPSLAEPIPRARNALLHGNGNALRAGLDPMMTVLARRDRGAGLLRAGGGPSLPRPARERRDLAPAPRRPAAERARRRRPEPLAARPARR